MQKSSSFGYGSGVYKCRLCKRQTRQTGRGDNEHVTLCAECYDLAGNENRLSDTGTLYDSPENILSMIKYIESKGGNVSCWDEIKIEAEKALNKSGDSK